jgi:hypothetical protein
VFQTRQLDDPVTRYLSGSAPGRSIRRMRTAGNTFGATLSRSFPPAGGTRRIVTRNGTAMGTRPGCWAANLWQASSTSAVNGCDWPW